MNVSNPSDIQWGNFGFSKQYEFFWRFLSFFLAFIMMSFGFIFVLLISTYKMDEQKNQHIFLFSISLSTIISLTNTVLRFVLTHTTSWEIRKTYSEQNLSIISKLTIFSFLNEIILIYFASKYAQEQQSCLEAYGVCFNIIVLFSVQLFLNPLMILLDFDYLWIRLKRFLVQRQNLSEKRKVFQFEMNEVFENTEFSPVDVCCLTIKTVATSFFYQSLIPYSSLMVLIQTLLNFYCWKYKFIFRSKIPKELDPKFMSGIYYIFDAIILVYCLGYFVNDHYITGSISLQTFLMIGVVFIDLLTRRLIHKKVSPKRTTFINVKYSDV